MRRHPTTTIAAVAALTLLVACGGEDAAESILENALEAQGEGDVDIDFGDGGFSVETEEGSVTIDEDGNFVITDENGDVVTGDVDLSGDGISVESDEGDFSMEADEEGSMTFETDEGEFSVDASASIAEEWPDDVPEPSGLTVESGSSASTPDALQFTVLGQSDEGDRWAAAYVEELEAAGFTSMSTFTSQDSVQSTFERGDQTVSLIGGVNDGSTWDFFVTVFVDTSG